MPIKPNKFNKCAKSTTQNGMNGVANKWSEIHEFPQGKKSLENMQKLIENSLKT